MTTRVATIAFFLLVAVAEGQTTDGRNGSIRAVNHCLLSLRSADVSAALTDFASSERITPAIRQQLGAFAKATYISSNRGMNVGSTGSSNADFRGHSLLYLFGDIDTSSGLKHFTADAVLEHGDWKLTRLFVDGVGTAGSDRFTYDKIPRVNDAVGSMIAGESVLNRFMRAGEQGDLEAAVACWVKQERDRPDKRSEIQRLVTSHPAYFKGFQQVDEGRTGFGFDGSPVQVQKVTAIGKMTFSGAIVRGYSATLIRENGQFKIKSLALE